MPDTKRWGGPRRYKPGADGEMHRTWNGKLPEEFTPADTLSFMAIRIYSYTGRYRQTPSPLSMRRAMTIRAGRLSLYPERRM